MRIIFSLRIIILFVPKLHSIEVSSLEAERRLKFNELFSKKVCDKIYKDIDFGLKNKLEEERQSKLTGIASTRLSEYDKIYKARNGLAVVPVMSSACGGCGGFIPPQIVSEVRAGKGPHTCESCGRFLYFDSE